MSYNQKYKGYLFVNEMGGMILPNSVTDSFAKLLADNGLKKIRFYALRHSCASLLLKQGVPMEQIQEWLGHSDISTTANIYAYLDAQSKQLSAETMAQALTLPTDGPVNRWWVFAFQCGCFALAELNFRSALGRMIDNDKLKYFLKVFWI